jgi:L-lactate utilization protein LutB
VIAHGGKVVFCRTGQEAADFVLDLAKKRGVHMLVKSKSMTSEEIHFNERLEKHHLEAVETDLGEYILQLAHQRPYHIVAPALHLTRYDVADVFTKELGAENEVVIEKQTKFARGVLRQKFLQADIGVSGANFLIADSGAIVVVENEGNARLSTSAPKIHIAIAGIEKVIPRAQDLAVFLNLLGRSATGQPLTVYTSFLSGPRRAPKSTVPTSFIYSCSTTAAPSCSKIRKNASRSTASAAARASIIARCIARSAATIIRGFTPGPSAPSSRRSFTASMKIHGCHSHPACAARAPKCVRSKSRFRNC